LESHTGQASDETYGENNMSGYTKQEMEEAKASLASTLHKCEKIQEGGRLQSSQKTLNDRRVKALRIALTLIEKEMGCQNAD
jgi:hypothetical protein